jgi:hypothetical protein
LCGINIPSCIKVKTRHRLRRESPRIVAASVEYVDRDVICHSHTPYKQSPQHSTCMTWHLKHVELTSLPCKNHRPATQRYILDLWMTRSCLEVERRYVPQGNGPYFNKDLITTAISIDIVIHTTLSTVEEGRVVPITSMPYHGVFYFVLSAGTHSFPLLVCMEKKHTSLLFLQATSCQPESRESQQDHPIPCDPAIKKSVEVQCVNLPTYIYTRVKCTSSDEDSHEDAQTLA